MPSSERIQLFKSVKTVWKLRMYSALLALYFIGRCEAARWQLKTAANLTLCFSSGIQWEVVKSVVAGSADIQVNAPNLWLYHTKVCIVLLSRFCCCGGSSTHCFSAIVSFLASFLFFSFFLAAKRIRSHCSFCTASSSFSTSFSRLSVGVYTPLFCWKLLKIKIAFIQSTYSYMRTSYLLELLMSARARSLVWRGLAPGRGGVVRKLKSYRMGTHKLIANFDIANNYLPQTRHLCRCEMNAAWKLGS